MSSWPTTVIPNPLDTERWQPIDRDLARSILGLPRETPLLLFAALGGASDSRKGFDLLRAALRDLRPMVEDLHLAVLGEGQPNNQDDLGYPLHFLGHLSDDISLRHAYSSADALVVPSRLEAFGQVASEAQSCGTPVVAFNVGGLAEIVKHEETGYLAEPYDTLDLAAGIAWVLSQRVEGRKNLKKAARELVIAEFDSFKIGEQYLKAYLEAAGAKTSPI